jgi:hypothetical protein
MTKAKTTKATKTEKVCVRCGESGNVDHDAENGICNPCTDDIQGEGDSYYEDHDYTCGRLPPHLLEIEQAELAAAKQIAAARRARRSALAAALKTRKAAK